MKVYQVLFAATALVACAESSLAQGEQAPVTPACWATLPVFDTVRTLFEVHAEQHRIWRRTNPAGLSTDYLTSVAAAIARHVRLPAQFDARAFTVWMRKDPLPDLTARVLRAVATYKPLPGGPIGNVQLYGVGSSPAMERALAQAIIEADSAGSIPPLPPGSYPKELTLEITIGSRVQRENDADTLRLRPAHAGASRPVAVGHAYLERYRLAQGVEPLKHTQRVPWPSGEQGAGDMVTMEFIVDERGRAVVESAILVSADHASYASAVAKALPRMRFAPARSGSCPLRVEVRQTFVFRRAVR